MKAAPLPLVLTLVSLLMMGQVRAVGGPETSAPFPTANNTALERAVMHQINHHVIFPLDAEEGAMYGTVVVAFAVDVQGHLIVKHASSENERLRDYVVRKLGKVQVEANPTGLWNITRMRFTFRPQEAGL